jgi:hypothetical protein
MVPTPLLLVRQPDLTLLRPKAEQMFPIEHAEKRVMPLAVEGFMMNPSPASQVLELRGQHCCALTKLEFAHWSDVQSCTAP